MCLSVLLAKIYYLPVNATVNNILVFSLYIFHILSLLFSPQLPSQHYLIRKLRLKKILYISIWALISPLSLFCPFCKLHTCSEYKRSDYICRVYAQILCLLAPNCRVAFFGLLTVLLISGPLPSLAIYQCFPNIFSDGVTN